MTLCCCERFRPGNRFFCTARGNFPYGYGDVTKLGRFSILGAMEYNLLGFFFKIAFGFLVPSFSTLFQYILLMVIFVKLLSQFTSNKFLIYIAPVLLSLTPGMTIGFYRTLLGERNVIFYYAIFFFCFLSYLKKKSQSISFLE